MARSVVSRRLASVATVRPLAAPHLSSRLRLLVVTAFSVLMAVS